MSVILPEGRYNSSMGRTADVAGVTSGAAACVGRRGRSLGTALALIAAAAGARAGGALDALDPAAPDTLRVVLVRHGQAYSNLDPAPALPPEKLDRLTDLGREQSRRAGDALRSPAPIHVLTSPAGRARETAQQIAEALGADARVEERLRPLDLGRAPDGRPLDWDRRIAEWKAGRDPAPPGGESLEQLGKRIAGLVASLRAERTGRTVVLVAHSEVIAAYMGLLSGTPGAGRWPPRLGNGSLTVVDVPPSGPAKVLVTNHLPPERAPAR